ncbi:hypothetical protein [Pseudomonas pergaminensis]
MKVIEKAKAQKVVDKIQAGNFDENDVDTLFIKLRPYSNDYKVFREVADFVAHPDARNRGLVNEALEAFHLSMKFYINYKYQEKKLDLGNPIPLYIKKLLKFQIDRCPAADLRKRFNKSPSDLKNLIDMLFEDDKKNRTTMLRLFRLNEKAKSVLEHLLGFIGGSLAFTPETLISEIISVLKYNQLVFEDRLILENQEMLVLCVMLLMHRTTYEVEREPIGYCEFSAGNSSIPFDLPEELVEINGFGMLSLHAVIDIPVNGKLSKIGYPILQSTLSVTKYCDESLFSRKPVEGVPDVFMKVVHLGGDVVLLENGKLGLPQ